MFVALIEQRKEKCGSSLYYYYYLEAFLGCILEALDTMMETEGSHKDQHLVADTDMGDTVEDNGMHAQIRLGLVAECRRLCYHEHILVVVQLL